MRIKNTSKYPEDEVRALVEFASRGVNTTGVLVNVKNSKDHAYAGRAYDYVPHVSSRAVRMKTVKRIVVLRIGGESKFPTDNMVTREYWRDLEPGESYEKNEVRSVGTNASGKMQWKLQKRVEYTVPYGGKWGPKIELRDWREGMIYLAAHELRHVYQFKHRKRKSELDCERFAAKALARYRQEKGS